MAGNESQVLGAELERVLPQVPAMFERDDKFFAHISKRPVEVISSRDMRAPLEIRPNGNTGYFDPDGGDMGRGDFPDFDKAIVNSVSLTHRVELTQKSIWSTDDKRKAVINAFRHGLAKSMAQFRRDIDSQCMTDGTGVLGTITSVSTTAGVDTYTCTTDGFGVRLIRSKQKLNIFNSTLTTCRTAGGSQNEVPVIFYDLANKQISVPAVTGATAGDLIGSSGLQSTPPIGMLGVKYHNSAASTGTWLGFDRAQNPEIRANQVNANSAALTLPLPRLAINKIGDRIGMEASSKLSWWTHPAQCAAYEELAQNVMRIDKAAKEEGINQYFSTNMTMAGAPLKRHYSWDRTRMDAIDSEVWGRAELSPPGFHKNPQSGNYLFEGRGPTGGVAASWMFYITAAFNLFMNQPAGSAYISGLAVPAGY